MKRTAAKASDPNDLIAQLAATLNVEGDRKEFLARKNELLRGLTVPVADSTAHAETSSGAVAATTGTHAGAPVSDAPLVPLTAERTRRATELLARCVGPVAKILVERAAARVNDERALYGMLAEHVQNPSERSRFLRDAGYSQSN